MDTLNKLSLQHRKVFERIELIVQWEGRLNTRHLTEALGVTRQTASRFISAYKKSAPNNLVENKSLRCYEPSSEFVPLLGAAPLEDYAALFFGVMNPEKSEWVFGNSIWRLGNCQRSLSPGVVRPIIQAIHGGFRVDIAYASISNPDFEERIISPHALLHDGHRWHVRAWCEKNQAFRDFVLTRIRDVFNREGAAEMTAADDEAWNTWVSFSIEVDSRLSEAQRTIVALDYGMSEDDDGTMRRQYTVRGALVLYWLQQLRVDRYRERAEAQQIILSSSSQRVVERWLPH